MVQEHSRERGQGKAQLDAAPKLLAHPSGCSIEFRRFDEIVVVTSKREGRADKQWRTGVHLARLWYKGWVEQGFEPEGE